MQDSWKDQKSFLDKKMERLRGQGRRALISRVICLAEIKPEHHGGGAAKLATNYDPIWRINLMTKTETRLHAFGRNLDFALRNSSGMTNITGILLIYPTYVYMAIECPSDAVFQLSRTLAEAVESDKAYLNEAHLICQANDVDRECDRIHSILLEIPGPMQMDGRQTEESSLQNVLRKNLELSRALSKRELDDRIFKHTPINRLISKTSASLSSRGASQLKNIATHFDSSQNNNDNYNNNSEISIDHCHDVDSERDFTSDTCLVFKIESPSSLSFTKQRNSKNMSAFDGRAHSKSINADAGAASNVRHYRVAASDKVLRYMPLQRDLKFLVESGMLQPLRRCVNLHSHPLPDTATESLWPTEWAGRRFNIDHFLRREERSKFEEPQERSSIKSITFNRAIFLSERRATNRKTRSGSRSSRRSEARAASLALSRAEGEAGSLAWSVLTERR